MQRYHAGSCTSAVNNSSIGGSSTRDIGRTDSSSLPANFPVNSRRQPPLNSTQYKLKCDKEPLNSRLGPPDFHAPTPNCPEETLTKEYLQSGYRDTVEGLEESREILLTQIPYFNKTVVHNCKEGIRKRLRAINESRAQKRKAGQVYGVALSGSQLTKSGVFPEQRPCPEDFRKKWIEGLSQPHKRLRSLVDIVPQYRRKSVLEVLIRNNVPLLRATWFVKVTYLNLVRPGSASVSSGTSDKTQHSCSELWTKDVIEYLQTLLDEFFSKNTSHSAPHNRDRSPQMPYITSLQHRSGQLLPVSDGEEPSLHFRWWYIVRLLQWHHAEGLLLPSLVIDWVLHQLQEKQLLEIWQLLLPIVYGYLEVIVLSQTYVRTLASVALRMIRDPAPGGSDLVDNSRRAYTTTALIEMLRYLILAVPETFVALDCFPLPFSVVSHTINDGSFVPKATETAGKMKYSSEDVVCIFRSKGFDAQYQSLAFGHAISCIQKHAENLTKAVCPGYSDHCLPKAAQALDKSLLNGDIRGAYKFLFENLRDGTVSEGWVAKVSPCLRLSLKWFVNVNTSLIYSVFFLCEWATCDFRDFRSAPPCDIKFTGKKDLSQVHIAVRILKTKLRDMQISLRQKNGSTHTAIYLAKCSSQPNNWNNASKVKSGSKNMNRDICSSAVFESPGPLHDILVCWIDQHLVHKGEGLKRLHLFIVELIRAGIFYPLAYVRQLIVSGIMDTNVNVVDTERQKRHCRILKQLPGSSIRDALEESWIIEGPLLIEALQVYLNERRLILRGSSNENHGKANSVNISGHKRKDRSSTKDGSTVSIDQWETVPSIKISSKIVKGDNNVEELKTAISVLLQLPKTVSNLSTSGLDESQGSVRRPVRSHSNIDLMEATPGCEECRRAKRQKLNEERSSFVQAHSPLLSDEGDTWWVKKGLKPLEPLKVDQPLKATKQVTKSRQKSVRKTQSLAQLAASRIEGSQGASTSHMCDNKVSCPHHRSTLDGDTARSVDGIRTGPCEDIVSTGRALKHLRFIEKKEITVWLMTAVRQLIEETEKNIGKVGLGQSGRPLATADDRSSIRWKLTEDELSAILYLMDISDDLVSAVKFLMWLLPKVCSSLNSTIHSGRNVSILPRNVENQVCDVGEAFLLSSLRRYENILAAADLIPEALSSVMNRAAAMITSSGRVSCSGVLAFARYLLRKYSSVTSVIEWEKRFKTTGDKRVASELESGRSVDGELGLPLGVPAGVEDPDDFFRQKISGGRLPSRVGSGMRDVVQRNVEDAFHYLFGKDRKLFAAGTPKGPALEKWDSGYQIAQQIVMGLIDCIRQTGGAAQEGDPSLVASAVSAIVGSVGPTLAKLPDFSAGNNHSNISLATSTLSYAKCILRMHITCLCLLKEALGERQRRVFEIALATEASTALAGVFAPTKASRAQFQMSPETHDNSATMSNDVVNSSTKIVLARTTKISAAVSALIVGAIICGVTSLERLVTILRLKEGMDVVQFVRSSRSSSNGNARSVGAIKADSSVEVHVHWFRLLVGNCRTICEGLVVDLLGEPSIVALSRMQHLLPLSLVFPPAYSIFAFVMWRPFIMNTNVAGREDMMNQLYQSLTMAISDAIKHLPFRDVCLRDCQGLYDLMIADTSDAEFAKLLQLNGSDINLNSMAFVPLRARHFLNAMIDCKMPQSIYTKDDGSRNSGHGESKFHFTDSESKLQDKLVGVLDSLQPAKFHWQWVELRLLLNEQALIDKLQTHDMSLADAIPLSSPGSVKAAVSENENNFIEIIFTRLLVRPDAAALFSELIHLFGRSLEDSMLMQAKWFLGGQDVLFGRKTIRQRLINIAETRGFSVKTQFSEPWGWCIPFTNPISIKGVKRKADSLSLEEEVVEEGIDVKRSKKGLSQVSDYEGSTSKLQHGTEKALLELILPCIDQSSDESRKSLASDLIKQLSYIEQQIAAVTRGPGKPTSSTPVIEGQTNKVNTRKTIRGGSPGLGRRPTPATDSSPPSPAALRASVSLRVQLLMRFLPILCTDGELSARNMRNTLTSVILRLLGSQIVHEDANILVNASHSSLSKREVESPSEVACAASVDSSVEGLFDRLLLILHGLLSTRPPSWLRSKPVSKTTNEHTRDFSGSDRELLETLQNHLDCMQLPDTIRWRIQAAMPVLPPFTRGSFSCQPPVPTSSLVSLQHIITNSGFNSSSSGQRNMVPPSRTAASGKSKQQDNDFEVDPWTLLEDGAGSYPSGSNIGSGNCVNVRAASWLKGAVRVRRTDLMYVGAVDEDS